MASRPRSRRAWKRRPITFPAALFSVPFCRFILRARGPVCRPVISSFGRPCSLPGAPRRVNFANPLINSRETKSPRWYLRYRFTFQHRLWAWVRDAARLFCPHESSRDVFMTTDKLLRSRLTCFLDFPQNLTATKIHPQIFTSGFLIFSRKYFYFFYHKLN